MSAAEATTAYIARDRHDAMATGKDLPVEARGTALFADISGFTPLTEALTRALGPRRGVEELTGHLNRVYDALVGCVHRQRGSIIHFAGDAITCWFEGDAGRRAVCCGLAMQQAMGRQPQVAVGEGAPVTLSLKVGIATGSAKRFAVGDSAVQLLDVLAGSMLGDMAAAANAARRGEVVVAASTASALEGQLEVIESRPVSVGAGDFSVVSALNGELTESPWTTRSSLPEDMVRPWVLPAIFERLKGGRGEFLTELRPAVAVFMKFKGIDYDADPAAGEKLDTFVRWIQRVVGPLEGYLHHISVGDKGSYLYCTFGAPIAHEDDTERALAAALELRNPPVNLGFEPAPQIGISQGTLRTGAYGGTARRTYGVLGDEVNLAARLMEHAGAGEVLASGRTRESGGSDFLWEPVLPLTLKGKSQPVSAFRLRERRADEGMQLFEPTHHLPMVGRVRERDQLIRILDLARDGRGQVVELSGEAGMGKSRLVTELLQAARQRGFQTYGGQAQSIGTNTSYLAWWGVWRAMFHLSRSTRPEIQAASVAAQLMEMNTGLLPRLPLLSAVLNLALPDNDTTRSLDAKLRKASLESLLVECLRHRAERTQVLIVIEDAHWLDPLSRDLIEVLARSLAFMRVVLLIVSRPADGGKEAEGAWRQVAHCTQIRLTELGPDEAAELIRLKLESLGAGGRAPDPTVVRRLGERSQGNPFYLEELINYLRDQGLDPNDPRSLEGMELPSSLQSLILGRMDRLAEHRKPTLKVASVIGRVFEPSTISAIYPALVEGDVRADLTEFARLELTALERPEPQLAFIFKHVVTQEVAYETLAYATRARLHGELGAFLERRHDGEIEEHLDLLAFHFDRSDDESKRREYLLRAAYAAQARYANAAAMSYFRRALPLLHGGDRIDPQLSLGRVLETVGDWPGAAEIYRSALALAEELGHRPAQARSRTALAELHRKRGAYAEATRELDSARAIFSEVGDEAGVAQTLHYAGSVAAQQGAYDRARELYHQSLETRRKTDPAGVASLLSNLGIVAWFQGDFAEARRLYEEGLALRRQLGNRWAIGNSLNNLGLVVRDLGDDAEARRLLEECVAINRELGDRWSIANALGSLADVALSQGDYRAARDFLVENVHINRELGDRTGLAFSLELFAQLAAAQQQPRLALRLAAAAAALREVIGAPLSPSERERLERVLAPVAAGLVPGLAESFAAEGRRLSLSDAIELALGEETHRG
ncbi:MAG: tetratricopeptide repeat protein [Verrucomicrobiales bacterium]|nr:tetratricopeptide repeat protein [Verrucomicrobiales bacterium]